MELAVGRNDPCPCGSGRKYKNCCIHKHHATPARNRKIPWTSVFVGLGVLALGALAFGGRREPAKPVSRPPGAAPSAVAAPRQQFVPAPQPPGPVPAGKVWSEEHGHWHDLPASAAATATPVPRAPVPHPPGPAPEGKVWSPEHGHWHNMPGYVPSPFQLVDPPAEVAAGAEPPAPAESEATSPAASGIDEKADPSARP